MSKFMNENFLLKTEFARKLYFDHAKDMPIFDYHCHLIPEEIATNKRFDNITEIWLGGDHYKWRQMRTWGIDEERITGNADPFDKFMAWAETMENLIGNPLYHWTHLELQRYFGITDILNRENARKIYDECNRLIRTSPDMTVWGIMKKFNVFAVGTTDDPADDLRWHIKIREEGKCPANVIPSFRPDKAININKAEFPEYIARLSEAAGMEIRTVEDVVSALRKRLDFFVELGCKASDHALETCPHTYLPVEKLDAILASALDGNIPSADEIDAYRTYILTELAKMYNELGVAMQLHFAAIRDNNRKMFDILGPDTGYDASYDKDLAEGVAIFFNNLAVLDAVPKTILYSLNPKDYYSLGSLMGCWQGGGVRGRIQLGSAWWFCDHRDGMEEQMKVLGNLGILPAFIGMLTDSRSFLSYSRHEYFRRILCNILGTWAEDGEIPEDEEYIGRIVENISFNNAKAYFKD